jgi:2-iminoacetate synthase
MKTLDQENLSWITSRIKENEDEKYLRDGRDFINDTSIEETLDKNKKQDKIKVRDIIQKASEIERLEPHETATLLNITDKEQWNEIFNIAGEIKRKVYDNRIVTFAPLYCGSVCVNDCLYCAFRSSNHEEKRRILEQSEIKSEVEVLAGEIGHKRLIAVFGEHPKTDANYMAETLRTIYGVKVPTKTGYSNIRRVNINGAPLSISEYKMIKEAGIGTYQIFQETYHHDTYSKVHPKGTIKSNYDWRLYALHRAQEAGIDDVAIGALFGLYDWKFEVMGLLHHAIDLEKAFGIGPHTVSFPRLEPAANTPLAENSKYKVSDDDFKKLVAVLRLSIPYAGMILSARETAEMRQQVIPLGITQIDASTKIGIGAYSDRYTEQELENQQFRIGDSRSLDEVIRDLAERGYITSFCTAGYRCSRTGKCIMELLKSGKERWFCKTNAVLTYQEWLNDFASPATKAVGEKLIAKEIEEIKRDVPAMYPQFGEMYARTTKASGTCTSSPSQKPPLSKALSLDVRQNQRLERIPLSRLE